MNRQPNLLMVSYFYPPAATGVRRLLSLLRHLPEHGWNPLVLTCRAAAGSGHDPNPLDDPAIAAIPVVHTGSLDPYRLKAKFRPARTASSAAPAGKSSEGSRRLMTLARNHLFLPDDRMGWIPFAVKEGTQLVFRHGLRAIYSSNYPQSAHVVAMRIHENTGIPWLADFRDGWTQNPAFYGKPNAMIARGQHDLESKVARLATRLVTVSPPITRHLQSLRPPELPRVETIFNGFEPSEFRSVESEPPLHPGKFTLLYTGTFFGRRRPDEFFAALRLLLQQNASWSERLRVRLRCALAAHEHGLLGALGLQNLVEVMPPISHCDIVSEQRRADAFLLILEGGPGADIMVSQKLFEYLACGRPLFAILPEGAAAEILEQTGGATLCMDQDVPNISRQLGHFLNLAVEGRHPLPDPSTVRQFERPRQAERMARILHEMTGSG